MKSAYEVLKSDKELNHIIDNVNYKMNHTINFVNGTSDINYSYACHGRHHILFVVGYIEYILNALFYDEHMIELGKIAGLLHDIGCYYSRHDHARIGASMCLYFISKTNLNPNDLKIIEQAVLDHSTGTDIESAVGAAVIIADKMVDINRGVPVKADLIKGGLNNETELNKYDNPFDVTNIYTIKDIQLTVIGRDLIFNYLVEGDTEAFKNEYLIVRLKRTPIILTKNAATYVKCNCIYQVNGDEIES
jgi:hypothetical protein